MKTLTHTVAALLMAAFTTAPLAAQAADGLTLQVLAQGHSLVRVDTQQHYVLLPIEDVAPESEVRLVVDRQLTQTIRTRLAMNHVDYYVPIDLSKYAGQQVLLDVRSEHGREGVRAVAEAVWSKNVKTADTFSTENTERFRPAYHHTPRYAWMNDPNGMFYKDGEWHLCYQYGPYGSTWNNMHWGHSVSRDLVTWTQMANAVEPDVLGTIFSGSAVVDSLNSAGFGKDAIIAMYTQADRSQFQSMAYSTDGGKTFTPYKDNPVLTQPYEFRDPHMFYHEPTGKWISILASALAKEMDIYSSTDLHHWTKESSFGKGYGAQDGVWECPDLMELPIRGTSEKRWVLICNINPGGPFGGSAAQYFVGTFDGKRFTCDTPKEVTKWMDYGKDHYAAVSWNSAPDGRHTMIAWMSNWQYATVVPTKQFRSANTLPRDVELYRADDGELYLSQVPSPEIEAARTAMKSLGSIGKAGKQLPAAYQGACNIDLDINFGRAKQLLITLSNDRGERVVMTYDRTNHSFSMDRTKSGDVSFNDDFAATTTAPAPNDGRQTLRLFVDRSSIEAFDGQGRMAMTNLVFPSEPYNRIAVSAIGGSAKATAKVYKIGQ